MSKYVFRQLVDLLPHRVFDRMVDKYQGNKYVRSFTCWNQLLVMMFAQLIGFGSLREMILFCMAHKAKTQHLGFGDIGVTRSNLSKANQQRDYRIFEEFAYHLVSMAQSKRINRIFELKGKFYDYWSLFEHLLVGGLSQEEGRNQGAHLVWYSDADPYVLSYYCR